MKRVIFVVLALAVGCYAFPLSAQQDQELTNAVIAARSAETASEESADLSPAMQGVRRVPIRGPSLSVQTDKC
jgi:hypothetical protein